MLMLAAQGSDDTEVDGATRFLSGLSACRGKKSTRLCLCKFSLRNDPSLMEISDPEQMILSMQRSHVKSSAHLALWVHSI